MADRSLPQALRTLTLDPGQYALVEVDGVTPEDAQKMHDLLPSDLHGRVILVSGRVHVLDGVPAPPPRQPDRALRGYIEQANDAAEER